jgi:hypothetical protein
LDYSLQFNHTALCSINIINQYRYNINQQCQKNKVFFELNVNNIMTYTTALLRCKNKVGSLSFAWINYSVLLIILIIRKAAASELRQAQHPIQHLYDAAGQPRGKEEVLDPGKVQC